MTSDSIPPYICFVGKSGCGKTTLLEKLIAILVARGYRVATIKHHAHPEFEIDQPGKDTWRHYQAGAAAVVIASPVKMAVVRRLEGTPPLAELVAEVRGVDIVLVEGFSRDRTAPKVEIVRSERSTEPLHPPHAVLAYVSDLPLAGAPCFGLDDVEALADMLQARFLEDEGASRGQSQEP